MLMKMLKFLDKIDILNYFGYIPGFLINRKHVYRSKFGSFVFFLYMIVFMYFVVTSTMDFIININEVQTSQSIISRSGSYNLTNEDFSFGVKLFTDDYFMDNFTNRNDLEVGLNYITLDGNGHMTYESIPLSPCHLLTFFSVPDYNRIDFDTRQRLNQTISTYLCPDPNSYNFMLLPTEFRKNQTFLEFYVKSKSLNTINETLNYIKQKSPQVELIWSELDLKTDNKYNPFYTYIGSLQVSLHMNFLQKVDMSLQSIVIADNANLLTSYYENFFNDFNFNQPEGEVFKILDRRMFSDDLYDRKIVRENEENLYFCKFNFRLSGVKMSVYRNYQKFTDFLAGMTALTSNILLLLIVFMSQVNETLAKNIMINTLFSKKKIEGMIYLEKELNKFFKKSTNLIGTPRKNRGNILKSDRILYKEDEVYDQLQNDEDKLPGYPEQKEIKRDPLIEINKISFKKDIKQLKTGRPDFGALTMEFIHENIKFNFFETCIPCFGKKRTNNIYSLAVSHLEEFLDIETLFHKYKEVDMLKEYIFDEKQIKMFEVLSKFSHAKKFFSLYSADFNFQDEQKDELIKIAKDLSLRKNEKDVWILQNFQTFCLQSEYLMNINK